MLVSKWLGMMENGGLYMFLIGMLQGKNQIRKWKSFVALLLNYIYIKHQLGQKTSYTAFYTCNKCLNITFYRLSIFRVSQHFFDPYSFCHILHGFIFYGLWGWWPELVWGYNWWWVWLLGAVLAVLGELVHELIENSEWCIELYRYLNSFKKILKEK